MKRNGFPFKPHPLFGLLARQDQLPHEVQGQHGEKLVLGAAELARRYPWMVGGDPRDYELIGKIVTRVHDIAREFAPDAKLGDKSAMAMTLMHIHRTACPMELLQLLMSSNDDITHDVLECVKHWDRDAAQLLHGWKPRHAKKGGAS